MNKSINFKKLSATLLLLISITLLLVSCMRYVTPETAAKHSYKNGRVGVK